MNREIKVSEIEKADLDNQLHKVLEPVRVVEYSDHLDLIHIILTNEVEKRGKIIHFVREQLLQEFLNGNLKHTFNEKLIDDKKFVNTFMENLRDILRQK